MKYKVSELEGVLLDAAVTKAEGQMPDRGWFGLPGQCLTYSSEWEYGGPIIERERITVSAHGSGAAWHADHFNTTWATYGPTPLIAGMRAFVASRFGDEVELP